MKILINEASGVADAFFAMTKSIREHSCLSAKNNELILIGIFTAHRSLTGIHTHVERALKAGVTKEEIISAIVLALPVAGIASVNMALEKAMASIDAYSALDNPHAAN